MPAPDLFAIRYQDTPVGYAIQPGIRVTGNADGDWVSTGFSDVTDATFTVTADLEQKGANPALTVFVEHSADGESWATLTSIGPFASDERDSADFSGTCDDYVRVRFEDTGSGNGWRATVDSLITGVVASASSGGSGAISSLSDIPGVELLLDSREITGLSDGDSVATWPDTSGNGYDAVQAEGLNQVFGIGTLNASAGDVTFIVDDGEVAPVEVGPLNFDASVVAVDAAFEGEGVTVTTTGAANLADDIVFVEFTGTWGAKPVTVTVGTDNTSGGGGAVASDVTPGHGVSPNYVDNLPVLAEDVLNGESVVRFDGAIDAARYLQLTGDALDLFRNTDGCTVAVVYANILGSDDYVFQANDGDTLGTRRIRVEPNGGGANFQWIASNEDGDEASNEHDVAVGVPGLGNPTTALGTVDFLSGTIAAQASAPFTSDTPQFGTTPGPTPDTASLAIYVGASPGNTGASFLVGDIALIAVWQRALNALERRQVLEYLSVSFGTL